MNNENSMIHNLIFWLGNTTSLGVIITTILGWVPAVAATIAIVWYMVQLYESKTIQRLIENRLRKKLIKLKAEAAHLEILLSEKHAFEVKEQLKHLADLTAQIESKSVALAQQEEHRLEVKAADQVKAENKLESIKNEPSV